jgi:hypothetical protein
LKAARGSRIHRIIIVINLCALSTAPSLFGISPSDDLLIAGAARTNRWRADLFVNNPGATTVSVDIMWLERDKANTNPETESFLVGPDETLILEDVLRNVFGFRRAEGAFRITATGGVVTANLIAFSGAGSEDGTYGSGFEAIPAPAATSAGESTILTGAVLNDDFYTNLFALAGANGVAMNVDFLDPNGDLQDTAQVVLESYEPWLAPVSNLWDLASFDEGTVRVRVSAGSMVMLGSKVDRSSNDPTTLEQEFGAKGESVDGKYQFAIYDSLEFASGGNLEIDDGNVEAINGTYVNFDKVDGGGQSECTLILRWGFSLTPTAVEDFALGVEFSDSYSAGGQMTWTVTFEVDENLGFRGAIDAVGSDFTGVDVGCNGEFPTLTIEGGKSN